MFAKLAVVELRADRGVCSAECSSYACIKGSCGQPPGAPGLSRGLPTAGCPLGSHPGTLSDNADCSLCGVCVKACPNESVELRLRPPGADLWVAGANHRASLEEVLLMFLLLGAVGVHHLPSLMHLLGGGRQEDAAAQLRDSFATHAALTALALAAPAALAAGADAVASWLGVAPQPRGAAPRPSPLPTAAPFVRLAYGWLPLVWAASLAHHGRVFGEEAGSVLLAGADFVGVSQDGVPHAQLVPQVVAFLQWVLLVGGGGASTLLTIEIGRQAEVSRARVAAQCAGIFVTGALLWPLLVTSSFLVGAS